MITIGNATEKVCSLGCVHQLDGLFETVLTVETTPMFAQPYSTVYHIFIRNRSKRCQHSSRDGHGGSADGSELKYALRLMDQFWKSGRWIARRWHCIGDVLMYPIRVEPDGRLIREKLELIRLRLQVYVALIKLMAIPRDIKILIVRALGISDEDAYSSVVGSVVGP